MTDDHDDIVQRVADAILHPAIHIDLSNINYDLKYYSHLRPLSEVASFQSVEAPVHFDYNVQLTFREIGRAELLRQFETALAKQRPVVCSGNWWCVIQLDYKVHTHHIESLYYGSINQVQEIETTVRLKKW